MKKLRYILAFCFLIIAGAIVMIGCEKKTSGSGKLPAGTYTWLAGGEGGGWYTVAGEFARFLSEKEPGITIHVVPGGGIGNPVSLDQGEGEIAWGVGYVNRAAYNGVAPLFQKKYTNIASIAGTLSVDYYHFLAGKEMGITTIEQLAQKIKGGEKINLAAAASGTTDYVMASIILDYYSVSFDMIEQNGGSVNQTVYGDMIKMFMDSRVDYAIVNFGMPAAVVTEMIEGRSSVILAASNELIDYCHYTWGTVARSSGLSRIPGGTYPGIDNDVPAVCHSTEIIVSPRLPEAVAYTFTKVLNENKDFLVQIGANYNAFDPKGAAASSVQVPLHRGAARYYREAGVLQ
ncbi:MAG: TAXI family TRAP transporter solute-binding subunit [Treponema sp.]|nr:TAXI family TRAP transporter solute-binding subunit [Treponema sp.]